ncbi:MAG: hypothetical protein ABWX96_02100 [Propionibacteriaceae bacterium]
MCTANHCRSPLAEFILAEELESRDLFWKVSSAGTQARPGVPMHPTAARILERRDRDPSDWVSRSLDVDLIDRSDLILTAAEEHRGVVARMQPAAMSRTFTLLQFAHLSTALPTPDILPNADYGRSLLSHVSAARSRVQPLPRAERDVSDPMGQPAFRFRRCATTIERAIQQILSGVTRERWNSTHQPVASQPNG